MAVGFALVCAALMIAAYVSFGGSVPLAPQGYRFQLPLRDASNLVEGSDVQIAGVKVGSVVSVRRAGDHASATLQIQARYAPIRKSASAILRTKTLLGEAYIELAPGPNTAPPIPDGGQLPSSHVRNTVTLNDFLEAFAPSARARMRQLFSGLSQALADRSLALNNSLAEAAPVAGNLSAVAGTLSGETTQLQQLFNSSGVVLSALGQRQGDLQAAVTSGNAVLAATSARNSELAATVKALPPFLTQLRTTSNEITADSSDLDNAIAALGPVAKVAEPAFTAINRYVPAFKQLFADLPTTVSAGAAGLPALTRILHAVPVAFEPLYPAMRQLIPFVQLLSAYKEEALIAPLADGGSLQNGKVVGPGGKILSRPNFSAVVSNETIGGWVKRLPTDRSNPYPTPNGLSDFWTLGHFKSWDCRQTQNVLYLPPTGTGVPPCVTQGPWTYRGKAAYYPRLQEAPP
ncbi:MAG: MlaD family protein [Solirubrobacteraceae bacterium]